MTQLTYEEFKVLAKWFYDCGSDEDVLTFEECWSIFKKESNIT